MLRTNTFCWTNMTLRLAYPCVRPNPYSSASMMKEFHHNEASSQDKYTLTENLIISGCSSYPLGFEIPSFGIS